MRRAGRPQSKTPGLRTLPTGEVTFLFSDIEGSTRRWELHPRAMQAALARHEQILSAAIARHNGSVFKLIGDAFCTVFQSSADAVAAAIDAQCDLAEEDFSSVDGLRIRMGLHAGFAEERNADYFGPTVNRVARLMSIGHGGQVLVSGAVVESLRGHVPSNARLIDLGSHRLKDLTRPEHVWQLAVDSQPVEFPPLNSLDARPNNLPIQATSFVGREEDLEEAKSLMDRHRLLTLFGAGGVGKTRLALQAGADLLDYFPDGVWFADLAPLRDPELVAGVVAGALGMPQRGNQRVDEVIPQWLKHKHLLLILDNCEHVLFAAATLADAILSAAPNVKILATSRQALGLNGEVVHRLSSLAVPDHSVDVRLADTLKYGALALFVDRAKSADTRFVLSEDTAPIVAEICRRLDGIPLAIELAAARVRVLSIPNLARRIDDRFRLLTGGSRTALPRQKTLAALIDWSFGLLTLPEQTMFNRVGIFAGSFSLEAATTVCGGDQLEADDIFELLASLVDKSLIIADTTGERERYRMLESTRAYALEKLAQDGDRERLARKHSEYFRDLSLDAEKRSGTGSNAAWVASVEPDLDNLRAAMEWTLTAGHDAAAGALIAGSLTRLWTSGIAAEGRFWIERAQAQIDESTQPRLAARLWRGLAAIHDGAYAYECAQRSLALCRTSGDSHGEAWSMYRQASALFQMGRLDDTHEAASVALAGMIEQGDKLGEAASRSLLGAVYESRGDIAAGRDAQSKSLAIARGLDYQSGIVTSLGNLSVLEFIDGRFTEALTLMEEVLQMSGGIKDEAIGHLNVTVCRVAVGDIDGARAAARKALRLSRKTESPFLTAIGLQNVGLVGALGEQERLAARLIGYVNVQYRALGLQRESIEKWGHDKLMAALRRRLSDAEIESLAAEGASWSEDRATEAAQQI
ncbi:MAG TPA: adenylate/guanylate cyclase domain-containing protein [Candidatus Eremiobacteraceae bacterium]|nr:adenylate/guanylate cyclase domain-containing protein [Candidatus Eremiobacteraceae bacterium]